MLYQPTNELDGLISLLSFRDSLPTHTRGNRIEMGLESLTFF
jgi:hypothetical protein